MTASRVPALRAVFALLLAFHLPMPALAWNGAGHRLIAAIAWDQLDDKTRSAIGPLLREHPDYESWIKRAKDDDPDRTAFIEASTWPDDIRQDKRFYNASDEPPTPTLPGFPEMQRHRDWHYVNRPLEEPSQASISGQLDKQIPSLAKTIGSPTRSIIDRSYALPWLIHLVGDAHQPLHTSTKRDPGNPSNDLAINMIVSNPFNPRKSTTTLHAYWDDLPGPPWLRGSRLNKASAALMARHPPPKPSTSAQWLEESWQIAGKSAYPPDDESTPTIDEAFYEKTREIANRRVAEAGYRLAELLRQLF